MSFKKYLFVDRDGTLILEPPDYQIDSVEKFQLLPDVIPSLLAFRDAGYAFIMVTNQDGLGTESNPQHKFDLIQKLLLDIFATQGISFEDVLICPHFPHEACLCRKPQIQLVQKFLAQSDWDRERSFVIGDRKTDLQLARNMGLEGFQIGPELSWQTLRKTILTRPRTGLCERKTKETSIVVKVNLDDAQKPEVSTGIGFFDHMLEQLSHHGGFACQIAVTGDLHLDDHHTIEDTGIALGTALRQALGDKTGLARFGFYLPMDEASAQVALDLSGRSYFHFEGRFTRELINGMATEMVPHFFRSLAEALGATLHITMTGENAHHQVEGIFKAVARSLRLAFRQDSAYGIPSTKGIL